MIPVRIEVEGFLCYRDKRVIDLEDSDLWVFSGRNGSGKSAIFDAMTYALFKTHRGGKQGAAELIHADSAGLSVVFDFDLGTERYRLKRSLRRSGKTECQLFRRETDGDAHWPAILDADMSTKLESWIEANIGLTFETFTASVLLMQGQAEKLISSRPGDRHKILAGIVDLAKYEAIHKVADERRRNRTAACKSARDGLDREPEIEPAAIEDAARRSSAAEKARAEAEEEWKRLVKAEEQAMRWRELIAKRDEQIARRDHFRKLLNEADSIHRDAKRLNELDAVLPALREALDVRSKIEQAERDTARLTDELAGVDREIGRVASLADENRKHLGSIVAEIENDEGRKSQVCDRGEKLSAAAERFRVSRGHRRELADLDDKLAAYPDDLPAQLARSEAEIRDGREWKAALPLLKNFTRDRDALRKARDTWDTSRSKLDGLRAELPRIEVEHGARQVEVTKAEEADRSARNRNIEASTFRKVLAERVEKFRGLQGAASCDRCGQPLTREHYDEETARLADEERRLASAAAGAENDARRSGKELAAARTALAELEAKRDAARTAEQDAAKKYEQAEENVRTLEDKCRDHYDALDVAFRSRIAAEPPGDWPATTFPTREHLEDGQRLIDKLGPAETHVGRIRDDLGTIQTLRSHRERAADALAKIVLQPEDEAAETERDRLAAEYRTLKACLAKHALQKGLAEETRDRLAAQSDTLASRRAKLDKSQAVTSATASNIRDQMGWMRSALPETWRAEFDHATTETIATWTDEAEALRAQQSEARATELPRAQAAHEQAQSLIAGVDREIAEIPPSNRLTADAASARTNDAHTQVDRAEFHYRGARSQLDELERGRERRERLVAEAQAAEKKLAVAQTLAHLLGRGQLQRHLLREAERGIIDRANPILGEVSGGDLQLRLLDGDDDPDQALAMEALVRTHGRTQTHDVAFLSGSQKFRVAVSLALAIGQYARGRKEKPIESVVIDEGFGCLDRQGRDEMIAQLKSLKGRLARIVLVSHQEDFAESFDDGYRFEVIDGATVVEPFHR